MKTKAASAPKARTAPRKLGAYRAKRDFKKTSEPKGGGGEHRGNLFVIQKHDASRLHYDFRLEVDGVLKSWAVPKGVPSEKGERHLAVEVEDHPLEYGGFEGTIPEGEYGGGTVMLWDTGTFENLGGKTSQDLTDGKLHFALHGKKLKGEWTLVRTRGGEKGNEWLLIKSGESVRPISKKTDNQSSTSGRTMAQIAKGNSVWHSSKPAAKTMRHKPVKRVKALKFIEPMKATLVDEPPKTGDWSYELKFDGYRALALKSGDDVQLLSRNEKDFAGHYPEVVEAVAALPNESVILDGEIVAMDEEGRPSFQLLQALEMGEKRPPLAFYVFDLLHCDGDELLDRPLHERRELLEKILSDAPEPIRYSAEIGGDAKRLLKEVQARGLEGIIGKERASRYETGRWSRQWIKLKCVNEQEFVIGGYTPPEGTRKNFGALLLGVREGREWRFTGKVGSGFSAAMLKSLKREMDANARQTCPFANLPEKEPGRWSQNITPAEMKRCHWVEPKLVCQVRFTEWTRDGKLRHGVFLGLREDKAAKEVVREKPR